MGSVWHGWELWISWSVVGWPTFFVGEEPGLGLVVPGILALAREWSVACRWESARWRSNCRLVGSGGWTRRRSPGCGVNQGAAVKQAGAKGD